MAGLLRFLDLVRRYMHARYEQEETAERERYQEDLERALEGFDVRIQGSIRLELENGEDPE